MKVYLVTSGCYSDKNNHGIFSSREKAQAYIDKCEAANNSDADSDDYLWVQGAGDFNDIQEWELDESLKEQAWTKWDVGLMIDDGSLESGAHPSSSSQWGIPESGARVDEKIPFWKGRSAVRAWSSVSAKHALKLAAEKRQEWLRVLA